MDDVPGQRATDAEVHQRRMAFPRELHAAGSTKLEGPPSSQRRLQPFPDGSGGYPREPSFICDCFEQAPAMASLLREFVAGVPEEALRQRAESILRQIDRCAPREPGEDDE
jgi:hypothetical protein